MSAAPTTAPKTNTRTATVRSSSNDRYLGGLMVCLLSFVVQYGRAPGDVKLDRDTRDKFTAGTDQDDLEYGESACLETPPELFSALHEEFTFDVDLCASEENHLLPNWFGPKSPSNNFDALTTKPWYYLPMLNEERDQGLTATTRGYCNPPYGQFISRIIPKAVAEAKDGFLSVFLLPVRITRTFKDLILPNADIRFVDERIKFWYKRQPKLQLNSKNQKWEHMGALFDSYLAIFRPQKPGVFHYPKPPEVWTWRKKG